MATKRNDLTLARKHEVIKAAEKEKFGVRKLGKMFGCGKTQILRNKERIEQLYAANASDQRCQTGKRFRQSKFCELNEKFYSWYLPAVSKNMELDCLKKLKK